MAGEPTARGLRVMGWLVAGACAFTALLHLAALIWPSLTPPSPPWRHALFVAINGGVGAGFARGAIRGRAPAWFAALVLVLVVQQCVSHGGDLVASLSAGELDVQSVLVLAFMPLMAAVALLLARR